MQHRIHYAGDNAPPAVMLDVEEMLTIWKQGAAARAKRAAMTRYVLFYAVSGSTHGLMVMVNLENPVNEFQKRFVDPATFKETIHEQARQRMAHSRKVLKQLYIVWLDCNDDTLFGDDGVTVNVELFRPTTPVKRVNRFE